MQRLFITSDVPPLVIVSMTQTEWVAIRGRTGENVLKDVVGKAHTWPGRRLLFLALENQHIDGTLSDLEEVRDGTIVIRGFGVADIAILTTLITEYEAQLT